jgi:hypothetical protein
MHKCCEPEDYCEIHNYKIKEEFSQSTVLDMYNYLISNPDFASTYFGTNASDSRPVPNVNTHVDLQYKRHNESSIQANYNEYHNYNADDYRTDDDYNNLDWRNRKSIQKRYSRLNDDYNDEYRHDDEYRRNDEESRYPPPNQYNNYTKPSRKRYRSSSPEEPHNYNKIHNKNVFSAFVCNISFQVLECDVLEIFKGVTRVAKFNLVENKDDTGKIVKRFAFVTVNTQIDLDHLIEQTNGAILGGRPLVVRIADDRQKKKDYD